MTPTMELAQALLEWGVSATPARRHALMVQADGIMRDRPPGVMMGLACGLIAAIVATPPACERHRHLQHMATCLGTALIQEERSKLLQKVRADARRDMINRSRRQGALCPVVCIR